MNTLSDTDEGKGKPSVWVVYVACGCIAVILLFCFFPPYISPDGPWTLNVMWVLLHVLELSIPVAAGVGLVLVARALWRRGALLTIATLVAIVSGPVWSFWAVFACTSGRDGSQAQTQVQAQLVDCEFQGLVMRHVFLAAVAVAVVCLLRGRFSVVDVDDSDNMLED